MTSVKAESLALQSLLHWERTTPNRVALSQPMGHGVVRDFTWAHAVEDKINDARIRCLLDKVRIADPQQSEKDQGFRALRNFFRILYPHSPGRSYCGAVSIHEGRIRMRPDVRIGSGARSSLTHRRRRGSKPHGPGAPTARHKGLSWRPASRVAMRGKQSRRDPPAVDRAWAS